MRQLRKGRCASPKRPKRESEDSHESSPSKPRRRAHDSDDWNRTPTFPPPTPTVAPPQPDDLQLDRRHIGVHTDIHPKDHARPKSDRPASTPRSVVPSSSKSFANRNCGETETRALGLHPGSAIDTNRSTSVANDEDLRGVCKHVETSQSRRWELQIERAPHSVSDSAVNAGGDANTCFSPDGITRGHDAPQPASRPEARRVANSPILIAIARCRRSWLRKAAVAPPPPPSMPGIAKTARDAGRTRHADAVHGIRDPRPSPRPPFVIAAVAAAPRARRPRPGNWERWRWRWRWRDGRVRDGLDERRMD